MCINDEVGNSVIKFLICVFVHMRAYIYLVVLFQKRLLDFLIRFGRPVAE